MSEINRRDMIKGMGFLGLGFLFKSKGGLVDKPVEPNQAPSAIEITVSPMQTFFPKRIVIPEAIASVFVIENIRIARVSQMAGAAIPGECFSSAAVDNAVALDAACAGTEIQFRVRYVGKNPKGERFIGALIGQTESRRANAVLPIDSGCNII